ncbi:hypothetical protein ABT282_07090 [Streptomyces sp. NPDC000927]|uniref:hypothetical protein n=1 Tax=Streptomyces sp. NPDC000927 TaxID=3154371 RepID=UPI00331C218C
MPISELGGSTFSDLDDPNVEWLRQEQGRDDLERIETTAKRRDTTVQVIRGNMRRYHDWYMEMAAPVALVKGRTKWYIAGELDAFLDRILANDRPRSRVEKAAADVSRLREWVEDQERRERVRHEEWQKAVKDLKAARINLTASEEHLDLLMQ